MKIILFEPQIPQNTGNIIRTCHITGCSLVLVKPLGFKIDDKSLRRAGLDYAKEVNIEIIDDLNSYLEKTNIPFYFFSTKGQNDYTQVSYTSDCALIFGAETHGFSKEIYTKWQDKLYYIPMKAGSRSLNLSNAVAIVTYKAWETQGFIPNVENH